MGAFGEMLIRHMGGDIEYYRGNKSSPNNDKEQKNTKCITINTDASFHPDKKVGGYAFYIISDVFKYKHGGQLKTKPNSSGKAELMCIGNAIHYLLNRKEKLPSTKYLIINTDSREAIDSLTCPNNKIARDIKHSLHRLKQITKAKHLSLRHVKAHNGAPDARSWVNEWCDKIAKKHMRKQL